MDSTANELLPNLLLVYAKVNRTRKISDPLRIQLRELIVNNFAHAGLKGVTEIERKPKPQAPQKPGGKEMRRFVHPDAMKQTPQPAAPLVQIETPETDIDEAALAILATGLGNMAQNDPDAPQGDDLVTDQGEDQETETETTGVPKIPVKNEALGKPNGNESPASESVVNEKKPAAVKPDELVSMKPKAIAERYGLDVLTEYAKGIGVEVRTGASATQIAAAILTKLKAQ